MHRGKNLKVKDLPNPVKHQGKWARTKNGTMYKSILYDGGSVRWVGEGSEMHPGDYFGPTRPYILEYSGWQKFWDRLTGGPLEENVS